MFALIKPVCVFFFQFSLIWITASAEKHIIWGQKTYYSPRSLRMPHSFLCGVLSLCFTTFFMVFCPAWQFCPPGESMVSADILQSSMGSPEAVMFRAGHLIYCFSSALVTGSGVPSRLLLPKSGELAETK